VRSGGGGLGHWRLRHPVWPHAVAVQGLAEPLHRQPDHGGGIAFDLDGPAGVLAVEEVVAASLAVPGPALDIVFEFFFADVTHVHDGGVGKGLDFAGLGPDEGHASDHAVVGVEEPLDHGPSLTPAGGLAGQLAVVVGDQGVGGEHHGGLMLGPVGMAEKAFGFGAGQLGADGFRGLVGGPRAGRIVKRRGGVHERIPSVVQQELSAEAAAGENKAAVSDHAAIVTAPSWPTTGKTVTCLILAELPQAVYPSQRSALARRHLAGSHQAPSASRRDPP